MSAPSNAMKRVALYARISTREGKQYSANQIDEMQQFASALGWEVSQVYIDEESGTVCSKDRPRLAALLRDAASRRFDLVLVWALDRLTREGPGAAFHYITRLKANGVEFVSLKEEHFRTTGPNGELFIAIAAWIAKHERDRHVERINAGLERARSEGKHIGRPKRIYNVDRLRELKAGHSVSEMARLTGLSRATISRRLQSASECCQG